MTARRRVVAHTPWPSQGVRDSGYEELCPRQAVEYVCQRGHCFDVVFAAGVVAPNSWECTCGSPAGSSQPDAGEPELERRMDQVRQRRSDAELEEMLAEMLARVSHLPNVSRDAQGRLGGRGRSSLRSVSAEQVALSASDETVRS